jgi:hypothetical protein
MINLFDSLLRNLKQLAVFSNFFIFRFTSRYYLHSYSTGVLLQGYPEQGRDGGGCGGGRHILQRRHEPPEHGHRRRLPHDRQESPTTTTSLLYYIVPAILPHGIYLDLLAWWLLAFVMLA